MAASVVVGVLLLATVAIAGAILTLAAPGLPNQGRLNDLRSRVSIVIDQSITQLGRPLTAAIVALSGAAVTIATGWILGLGAHALQSRVDWPVFLWFQDRQVGWWSNLWWVLTNVGSINVAQALTVVSAIVFAAVWRIRGGRWWVPALTMLCGYGLEHFGQQLLKTVVDRGHPPTTLGTWPSGGCARVIVVYGLIIFLILRTRGEQRPRAWWAGASVVAFLVTVEGYARTYNLEHWVTDVLGGVVFGTLLLAVMVASVAVLDRHPADDAAPVPEHQPEQALLAGSQHPA